MLDILLLILFAISLAIGARRGFILQAVHLVSYVVALIVAFLYYKSLAQKFVLWIPYPGFTEDATMTLVLDSLDIDRTFYRVFAFAIIFFAVKITLQIVGSMFDFLAQVPVFSSVNYVLGAALCFIEVYLLLFIALYVLALIPLESIQSFTDSSFITKLMLEHTPIITGLFQDWWYIYTN